MRTFIALCFSVGTTRRIAEAMEQKAALLKDLGWKLAWVPPANLHLTLSFLGSIPPESVDAIATRLRQRLVDLSPITLRAQGAGSFPRSDESSGGAAPRVLWIGVTSADQNKALFALQKSIAADMEDLGFPKADPGQAFFPHITIARVIEPAPADQLAAWPAELATQDFGEDRITEVVVYESLRHQTNYQTNYPTPKSHRLGAEYVARARVPFTK